jgi:acetylornithine/succinyldiaminopimelate/putrescine aminotransferase/predicted amino acid dehydrogenase
MHAVKFGFVLHPLNAGQLRAFSLTMNASGSVLQPYRWLRNAFVNSRQALESEEQTLVHASRRSVLPLCSFDAVTSRTGARASGIIVSIPLLPEQILSDRTRALKMIHDACEFCAAEGAELVGLGGYTGIIGSRGHPGTRSPIPVTTGNSYAAFAAVAALDTLLARLGRAWTERRVVVVGFAGSLGLAITKMLAKRGADLVLVGRRPAALPRALATWVAQCGARAEVAESVESGVTRGDVVVSATSSGTIIDEAWFRPGTLVLDLALPRDVHRAGHRPDVLLVDGGLVTLPAELRFSWLADLCTDGAIFGCLAETMILALERRAEPFSSGRELDLEKIDEIGRLGAKHGFGVDEFLSRGVALERGVWTRFRKAEARASGAPGKLVASVSEALRRPRPEVFSRYRGHIDPFLGPILRQLDCDKNYVRAEGIFLWDDDGHRYLDFASGFGALNVGHNHPRVLEAVRSALAGRVPNFIKPTTGALTTALAEVLALIAPGDLDITFFCNSGTEANEAAIKLARSVTGRRGVAHASGSFHGKTCGSLSLTDSARFRRPFEPLVPDTRRVRYGDATALETALRGEDIAAFILEPIQGEGGIVVPPAGYLKQAQDLCRRFGTLLILDEIQTGFGRTGTMFAAEYEGVEPDVLTLAKSLSGGLVPIGAMMTTGPLWECAYGRLDAYNLHTSTFGGNAVASAAALTAIRVLYEEGLIENARGRGEYFSTRLRELAAKHPTIRDVRGRGLMLGLELVQPLVRLVDSRAIQAFTAAVIPGVERSLREISAEMLMMIAVSAELLNEARVIAYPTLHNGLTLRLQPPLLVKNEHIDHVIEALDRICQRLDGLAAVADSLDATTWSR